MHASSSCSTKLLEYAEMAEEGGEAFRSQFQLQNYLIFSECLWFREH